MTKNIPKSAEEYRKFSIVVAAEASSGGIGIGNGLPWSLKDDMLHFRKVTCTASDGQRNAVIMGRKTWDSLPVKFRPLPNRLNVVLTRQTGDVAKQLADHENTLVCHSLEEALETLSWDPYKVEKVFVIGGGQIYAESMRHPGVERVYLTRVWRENAEFDTTFEFDADAATLVDKTERQKGVDRISKEELEYEFCTYDMPAREPPEEETDPDHEELQYLRIVEDIIKNGVKRGDRTGVGTMSKFGVQMRYNLRRRFPLMTTKTTFWRGVAEELVWFVNGSTNANELAEKRIHIWDGNGSREFLDKRGLGHREVGDLGPVYGFQWRHFGAEYKDMHTDYSGKGVDQLAQCIKAIKENPESRRIIMTAWNPAALPEMALPPCHMFCQFYVDTVKGELSCQMYQRSADMGLGVPFNIASYSLLTYMVAQVCGLKPGEFVHVIGDAHVYLNHIEPLQEQLARTPYPFPRLKLNPAIKNIDDFTYKDFKIIGYQAHKRIKMEMAV